jgi:hypothetical protein
MGKVPIRTEKIEKWTEMEKVKGTDRNERERIGKKKRKRN